MSAQLEGVVVELLDPEQGLPERFGDYGWEALLFHPAEPAEPSEDSSWEPQELFVRLLIRWKQSGQARSESFFTILLPRNGR